MAKQVYETLLIQGGFAGNFYDINQGPLVDDIIDILLNSGAVATLQVNAPLYIASTGSLNADRILSLINVEDSGRLIYFKVNNDDIGSYKITITPSNTINNLASIDITLNGDYLLTHNESGDWRAVSLWTIDEKSNLELELEYKLTNLKNYKTLLYTGNNLTTVNTYEDNTMLNLLFVKNLSYSGANLVQTILTRLSDGATITKNLTYSSGKLVSVEVV